MTKHIEEMNIMSKHPTTPINCAVYQAINRPINFSPNLKQQKLVKGK